MGMGSVRIPVTVAGAAGSATGTAYSETIQGVITGVKVDYVTAITTTTVVITEEGGMNQSILSIAAGAVTDIIRYPTAPAHTQTGTEVGATTVRVPITLAGSSIKVVVALSDALADAVIVTVYVMS